MNRGIVYWTLLYGGTVFGVWAIGDVWAAITYLSGLGVAVLVLFAVDYVMRDR